MCVHIQKSGARRTHTDTLSHTHTHTHWTLNTHNQHLRHIRTYAHAHKHMHAGKLMNCHIRLWSNAETIFKKQQMQYFSDSKTNVIITHAKTHVCQKVCHLVISSK